MPTKVKVQAKDVSSAIAKGLKDLGLRRDQVEVTVLEHPKKGFLGIGAKPALVEIRQKRWSTSDLDAQIYMDVPRKKRGGRSRNGNSKRRERDAYNSSDRRDNRRRSRKFDRGSQAEAREKAPKANEPQLLPSERIQNAVIPENLKAPMQEAKQYLNDILSHMGIKVENLNVWWDEQQQRILLTFDCDHPAIVIGKEGKTLEAIQYLCTLSLSRHFDKPISVITDTQNYWRKAEDKINAEIERGIAFIESGNSIYRFRPMSAQLRRYIHRALEGNATVATSSEGEGKWRKVTLRRKTQQEAAQTPAAVQAAPAAAVQEALQEAQAEKDLQSYAESSSCCSGEEAPACSCGHDCCSAQPEQPVCAEQPCHCEQPVSSQETVMQAASAQTQPAAETACAAPAQTEAQPVTPAQPAVQENAPAAVASAPACAAEKAPADNSACCGPLFAAAQDSQEHK